MNEIKRPPKPSIDDKMDFQILEGEWEGYVKITRTTKIEETIRIENALAAYSQMDTHLQAIDKEKNKILQKKQLWEKGVKQMEEKQKQLKIKAEAQAKQKQEIQSQTEVKENTNAPKPIK